MMYIHVISVIIFLSTLDVCVSSIQFNDVQNHLGTRTPYRFKYNKNDAVIKYPECRDEKIWMIIRHGTRLPNAKDINEMNTALMKLKDEIISQHSLGKGKLSKEQVDNFKQWSSDIDADHEKHLTLEGQDEMVLLAERMKNRFPNAVRNTYNNDTFHFQYTPTQRAQQSARYFTLGLFDKSEAQRVIFAPALKVDPVLRFYKHCDRWQKQVKKNSSTYKEQRVFGKSKEMNDTLGNISERLGLSNVLGLGKVEVMYKVCGYETSWYKHRESPWCYAFDVKDAEKLEYYYDLKHYWRDGYAHDLTHQQACYSLKAMFDNFSNDGRPNATFLFSHSGTLLKVLAHLQMYRPPSHLTSSEIKRSRAWKASDIDCFASNLAFVLYRCKDGDKMLTLHQETIIQLPMCKDKLCSFTQLKEYFHDTIHNCKMSDLCSLDQT